MQLCFSAKMKKPCSVQWDSGQGMRLLTPLSTLGHQKVNSAPPPQVSFASWKLSFTKWRQAFLAISFLSSKSSLGNPKISFIIFQHN